MPDVSFLNLLVVACVAAAIPLALGWVPRLRVPAVVLEIVAGVVLGPSVLGWIEVDLPVQVLALFGLAFLLMLAGLEIDLRGLRGRLLGVAALGYGVSLVLAVLVGWGTQAVGWTSAPLFLAIALTATSLGLVVPVLKDAGRSGDPVGQTTIAAASVADFAAIVLLSLLFSMSGGGAGTTAGFLAGFGVLVVVLALGVGRVRMSMRLGDVLVRLQDTTAEIRVRLVVLLLVAFVALAERLGLETILGAFLAGALVGLVDRDSSSHPRFRAKLDAIGYGFLIPVFFVSSGVQLDLRGLLEEPAALLQVPVFLAALLVVRGLPAVLYRGRLGRAGSLAAGLLQATSLPFLVTVAQIGTVTGRLSATAAAALVFAGLLSVLVFPAAALGILGRPQAAAPQGPGPATGGPTGRPDPRRPSDDVEAGPVGRGPRAGRA
ncbi:cation:proton antiporter [Geodermatophilus sp. YIM 151500]|uniref:cation:proton antiporter n=1 Tax=Geodermatophilus sp. YIM 151500 TaxID=2984531 RepID=UPI0021E424E1|nr:cation:proton antiporter [Geodermatophilus sp. YIM 151500]MCV2491957.1 cation:proton antiporter [Geodermatophilus sp. YIM 151500]